MIDQFYDANGDGAFSELHTATEEAGHLTAHDARWVKQWLDYLQTSRLQVDIHPKNEFCGWDGKKNWRKIWPKNGLKLPKIA